MYAWQAKLLDGYCPIGQLASCTIAIVSFELMLSECWCFVSPPVPQEKCGP